MIKKRRSLLLFALLGFSALLLLAWGVLLVTLGGRIDRFRPEIQAAVARRVGGEVILGTFHLSLFSGWRFAPGITSGRFDCRDPLRGDWCQGDGFEIRVTTFPDFLQILKGEGLKFTEAAEFTLRLDKTWIRETDVKRIEELELDLVINGVGVVSRMRGKGLVHYRTESWSIEGPVAGDGSFKWNDGLYWSGDLHLPETTIAYLKLIRKEAGTPFHFRGEGVVQLRNLRIDQATITAPFGQIDLSGVIDLPASGPHLSLKLETKQVALREWKSVFPWDLGGSHSSEARVVAGTLRGSWMVRGLAEALTCEGTATVGGVVLEPAMGLPPFSGTVEFKGREAHWLEVSSGFEPDQRFTWVGEQVRFPFIADAKRGASP